MIGLVPCSGACNVGQLSAKAVVRVMAELPGQVGFICALGLPLGIPGIVKKAHESYSAHIGIDGCSVGCATKALQSVGVKPVASVVVTDAACLEKSGDLSDEAGLDTLTALVAASVEQFAKETA